MGHRGFRALHNLTAYCDIASEAQKGSIAVLGSGELVQTLIESDLVDGYSLIVSPIVLGTGKRLFRDPDRARNLRLVDCKATATGTLLLTYEPAS